MKNINSELLQPISFGIIENQKSYWANHFYSIIECIHSHKNLQYTPIKMKKYPIYSLNDMRGYYPMNFFETIQPYIQNWGFQYFLASYLNNKASVNLVTELVNRLSNMYNVDFSPSLKEFNFYISGHDTILSKDLADRFTTVFPLELKNEKANTNKLINESDLCLILKNPLTEEKVGIFGEVEGVYGNKLKNKSYWEKKQDFCVFSFGVIKGKNKQIYMQNLNLNGINRVVVYLEQENYIVTDFNLTLSYIKNIFMSGVYNYNLYSKNEEFDYFLNILIKNWNNPIDILLNELSKFINGDDIVAKMQSPLSIITDIQA